MFNLKITETDHKYYSSVEFHLGFPSVFVLLFVSAWSYEAAESTVTKEEKLAIQIQTLSNFIILSFSANQ